MNIEVSGIEPSHRYSIEHIIRLFFEEPVIHFADEAGGSMPSSGEVTIAIGNESVLRRQLHFTQEPLKTSEEHRKARKRETSKAVLELLQEYTGIEQPWGILTGIRPTKLAHQKARAGVPQAEAERELKEEALIQERKIRLMHTIVERQLSAVPDLYQLGREVSVYIGIPFCPTKCAYCTFPAYAIGGRQGSVDSFLGGLHYEMREVGRWLKEHGVGVTTVYFGGGTPTSITADEMDRLYAELYESFPDVSRIRELTVEAGRPDTITREKLDVLRKWGVHRISINPQSYTQETLDAIGRHHTVEETIEKFWLAREMGIDNINMDLIIGLPGEGVREFAHTLEQTARLMPESLTVHTLSFKRASEMTRNRDKYKVAGREEVQAMTDMASEWCRAHGYAPYYLYRQKNILGNLENVGYCKPGRESIYNIMIMEEMQSIVGLGCGAASKWVDPRDGSISRYANPKEPRAYNENFMRCTEAKLETLERLYGDGARKTAMA